ncbi:unnamed protein product [Sphagnum jensenii]|uniref:CAAX prenyl protease 2/Lysostaphin resistance protein A-like domain-containing protein n=1 Tax=Sphagnum jensenii TaxID=128206 RepID=A0ABP1BSL2_9BRYO
MVVASAMQGLCGVACTVSSVVHESPSSSSSAVLLKPFVTRPGIAVSIGNNNNNFFCTETFWRFDVGRGGMTMASLTAAAGSKLAATTPPLQLLHQIGTTTLGSRRRYNIITAAAASIAEARPLFRVLRLGTGPRSIPEQQQALLPCSLLRKKSSSRCFFARNKAIAEDDDDLVQVVNDGGGPPTPEPGTSWPILERWNVPWDGKVTAVGMAIWLFSFLTTGIAVSAIAAYLGISRRQVMDLDEQALFIFVHQLAQTIAGLSALNVVLAPHQPYPPQLFSYDWSSPFDLRRGWLLYGGIGVIGAAAAVVAVSTLAVTVTGQPPPREADALLQLLPIIGASPASTAALIAVTGILAPILEESVFRGFLMTSLTKWVPTPVAVVISACAFAGAHLTPGEFPQLLALGVILGLAYAQTRTLITPILIHATWNSGVIVLLTLLRVQGYDIREFL